MAIRATETGDWVEGVFPQPIANGGAFETRFRGQVMLIEPLGEGQGEILGILCPELWQLSDPRLALRVRLASSVIFRPPQEVHRAMDIPSADYLARIGWPS